MSQPMNRQRRGAKRLSRRSLLAATASGVGLGLFGCRAEPEPEAKERPEIPLRVVWAGDEEEFVIVRRAWASVSPLPLEVTLVAAERQDPAGFESRLLEAAEQGDVLIYPLCGVAGVFAEQQLTPLVDDIDPATLPPALRNAAAKYADVEAAIPLGTIQPALLSVDGDFPAGTWSEYDAWVEQMDGAAAEPLAEGWAAAMFLLRAATTLERYWLFHRDGLEPLIATEPYVEVLDQMHRTAARYRLGRVSPAEIWSEIQRGNLRGGIGFPAGPDRSAGAASFANPPSSGDGRRVLLDAFAPVGSLAAACRQTAASKRFLKWLAGGPGSEPVRRQIERMTLPPTPEPAGQSAPESLDSYQGWLADYLQTAVTRPTLQLLHPGDYYASLNEQVTRCLDGEATPEQALAGAAERWRQITEEVGVERQQQTWRRAQGMLG